MRFTERRKVGPDIDFRLHQSLSDRRTPSVAFRRGRLRDASLQNILWFVDSSAFVTGRRFVRLNDGWTRDGDQSTSDKTDNPVRSGRNSSFAKLRSRSHEQTSRIERSKYSEV